MNKAIYIASIEANTGKSIISIGLMQKLLQVKPKVAYFRPIIKDYKKGKKDNHITTIKSFFGLKQSYKDTYVFTQSEVIKKINSGKEDEVINQIIAKYKKLEQEYDFIIVEDTDFSGNGTVVELDLSILIAKNLNIPVIIVASGEDKDYDDFISGLKLAYDSFSNKDVQVLSVVANKVLEKNIPIIKARVANSLPKDVSVNTIPIEDGLKNPTIKEIIRATGAKLIFGKERMNAITGEMKIGAMQLSQFLKNLTPNSLVITPGDRSDIILGTMQAHMSKNYPDIAGIILTGGIKPKKSIVKLIDGLERPVPVLTVKKGTFITTENLTKIRSHIYAGSKDKIKLSLDMFNKYVEIDSLADQLTSYKRSNVMTPRMFQYNLINKAKQERKHIVLPEGNDDRILKAVSHLQKLDIVDITILGKIEKITNALKRLDLDFDFKKTPIIDPVSSEYYDEFSQTLFELRKHKGVTETTARDLMLDVSYFGTMMVYKGLADGMVSGAAHTTQHTILPALQFVKTRPGFSVVSSVFFMCLEDRVSVFGDCAINPNPTAEQLAEIAISSADSSISFGIDPKIAMLSYSSGASGKGEDVDIVRKATAIVKEKRPELKIEGPIQYDAAVDPSVGKKKMPNSEVAGQANVLIFPDLNTGNNTYKAVQRETGALAIGPMLQGLNKPVNDLSRGCTVDDIYNTVIITAIQAQRI